MQTDFINTFGNSKEGLDERLEYLHPLGEMSVSVCKNKTLSLYMQAFFKLLIHI